MQFLIYQHYQHEFVLPVLRLESLTQTDSTIGKELSRHSLNYIEHRTKCMSRSICYITLTYLIRMRRLAFIPACRFEIYNYDIRKILRCLLLICNGKQSTSKQQFCGSTGNRCRPTN